jgi:hypothetical protein
MNYREDLQLLARKYTYSAISAQTGIPQSTISYVLSGQRELPEKYGSSLTAAAYFEGYSELRSNGAGETSAQIIAGQSLSNIDDAIYNYQSAVEEYAKNWLATAGKSQLNEETGLLEFYNLDKAIDKWAAIISRWDTSLTSIVAHRDDPISSDPDWLYEQI